RLGGRYLARSGALLAMALAVTAIAPQLWIAIAGLVSIGAAGTAFIIGCQARLQLNVDEEVSGRVMALYSVGFLGARPIGGMLGGWMMDASGARLAFAVGAVMVAASIGVDRWLFARR